MYKVKFYKNKNGESKILNYLHELKSKNDKSSRIKLNKINDYISYLEQFGQSIKEPYAKHLEGDIWELRPIRDRILYVARKNNSFLLLHIFQKDTQKTPKHEIKIAKQNLVDYTIRGAYNEK